MLVCPKKHKQTSVLKAPDVGSWKWFLVDERAKSPQLALVRLYSVHQTSVLLTWLEAALLAQLFVDEPPIGNLLSSSLAHSLLFCLNIFLVYIFVGIFTAWDGSKWAGAFCERPPFFICFFQVPGVNWNGCSRLMGSAMRIFTRSTQHFSSSIVHFCNRA